MRAGLVHHSPNEMLGSGWIHSTFLLCIPAHATNPLNLIYPGELDELIPRLEMRLFEKYVLQKNLYKTDFSVIIEHLSW